MKEILHIKNLSKAYHKSQGNVIENITFKITEASIIAIVGESGSGKTTLARLIAGLEVPDSGSIELYDEYVSSEKVFVEPEKRAVGMVFQDYALFPHLTVQKNVSYGLSVKKGAEKKVQEVLELVGLTGFEDRYPHQLSGGQQQRVALARAIVPSPKLLILDEPFSNLDVALRLQLRNEIFHILKKTNITVLFITHDTQDAMAISDEIIVLKKGEILQKGTTENLYNSPKNAYIAALFSNITLLKSADLKCFKYETEKEKKYAVRLTDFKIQENATFQTEVDIVRSISLGSHFLHTAILSNKSSINFISNTHLTAKVQLGFETTKLLQFEATLS